MKFLFVVEPISYEWLGMMYVSAILKTAGFETRLFIIGDDLKDIVSWKPDYVGYSVMTGSQTRLLRFNRELKKNFNFISIFGGPHPTFFPEMAEEEGVDSIIRGESETSILQILDTPRKKVIFGELPQNLDDIPFPDRNLIYSQCSDQLKNPVRHFIASRGCPYDCPYCYNSVIASLYPGQKRVRFRSPENVLLEIEYVVRKYPTKFIYFQDDCFDLNKQWLSLFLPLYKKRIGLPFHCMVRLDLLDDVIARNLKEAGCVCVRCAVESGNDSIRNTILKRKMSRDQILEGTRLLKKFGIKFVLQNILGLPMGNLDTDIETLWLNIECRPTLGWASIFQPYPGTELGKLFPSITVDKINPSFYEDSPLDIPNREKIRRLQKLFGITVRFSFLYRFLPLLLCLPFDAFYRYLWKWNNARSDRELYGGIL